MKKLLAAGLLVSTGLGLIQDTKAEIATFIGEVKPELEIRPRLDWTSKNATSGATDDATALTTRVRLGAHIDKIFQINGLKAYLEMNDVSAFIDNKRSVPGESCTNKCYPFIFDPSLTRLTEAKLLYTVGKTTFLLGRTRVNLDDQRFISDANWRQTPQTFGVVGINTKEIPNLDLLIAAIYERKHWTDAGNSDWRLGKTPLVIHGTYTLAPALKLNAFAYLVTDVNDTYGINARGDIKVADNFSVNYLVEYATQNDPYKIQNQKTKPKVDGDFYRIYVGAKSGGLSGRIGYYVFSEYKDNGAKRGFSTPLTTYHGFEGWADVLAAGTANGFYYGLKAWHFTLSYSHKEYGNFDFIYYKFDSKTGGKGSYGNEIDLQYTKALTKRLSFLAKAAFYNADKSISLNTSTGGPSSPAKDVTKYWLQLTYRY